MNPIDALAGAAWVGSAGGVCALVVQLVKYAFAEELLPRVKVGVAALTSLILVLAYAASSGLLVLPNLYLLIIAVPTITATGAGLHSAITASASNKPTP